MISSQTILDPTPRLLPEQASSLERDGSPSDPRTILRRIAFYYPACLNNRNPCFVSAPAARIEPPSHEAGFVVADRVVRLRPAQAIALLSRHMVSPVRIVKMGARQDAEVGAAGGEHAVHVLEGRNIADRHGRDARLQPHPIREGGLEETAIDRLLVRDHLPRRDVHDVAAM